MAKLSCLVAAVIGIVSLASSIAIEPTGRAPNPCDVLNVEQNWLSPKEVRDCFASVPLTLRIRDGVLEVINKTLPFHASQNYQLQAPAPFADTHVDIDVEMARIQEQDYASEYDFHLDLSRTFKRANDGHLGWMWYCYDYLYYNVLPTPLVLITNSDGHQNIHIAPEAFEIAKSNYGDQIDVWQEALPGSLKGQLESLSGAKVLVINGQDPFAIVDAYAETAGESQGFSSRQNSFFSSYQVIDGDWNYNMGGFAQQSLPLSDSVTLTILRVNGTDPEEIVLPYRSRGTWYLDGFEYWRNNYCNSGRYKSSIAPKQRTMMNKIMALPHGENALLPPPLQPSSPILDSLENGKFYMLENKKTGVLALGSFDANWSIGDSLSFMQHMLDGLLELKRKGATQLIVDVSNNEGGLICAANWLHRIIAGPKATTIPEAGLDSKARSGVLAQHIVEQVVDGQANADLLTLFDPQLLSDATGTFFERSDFWIRPINVTINGRPDAFSQRLGDPCRPEFYPTTPPDEALFDPKEVVIVSNGKCSSSCSIFSITMKKKENSRTVVVGGKADVRQQYCGAVGGQSADSDRIYSEQRDAGLSEDPMAVPSSVCQGYLGVTWRLAYGVDDPEQPEEWQDHSADVNLPLTIDIVNNPVMIWEMVQKRLFP